MAAFPITALLLLLLTPTTARDVPSETLCMDSYATFFQHQYTSSDGPLANTAWTWSLGALCLPNGTYTYSGAGTSGQTLYFNILGNTSVPCSDYVSNSTMYESWGVATQYYQSGRGERSNAGCTREDDITPCADYTFIGETTCCSTRRCEVIALEAFRFSLVDLTNPATGGVVLDHQGMPASPNDYEKCPMENGLTRLREFRLTLECDPDATELVVTAYDESDYCRFYVTASTALACGTQVVSPSPYPSLSSSPSLSSTSTRTASPTRTPTRSSGGGGGGNAATSSSSAIGVGPGGQFGFTILGAFLCIAVQAFYYYWHNGTVGALLAKAGVVGGKSGGAAFPSAPSSSAASASAPSTGFTGGYGAVGANASTIGGGERKSLL